MGAGFVAPPYRAQDRGVSLERSKEAMSRYFHGMVSRFSAGGRDMSPSGAEIAVASSELVRFGISPAGAVQLVTGKSVTSAADRELVRLLLIHLTTRE